MRLRLNQSAVKPKITKAIPPGSGTVVVGVGISLMPRRMHFAGIKHQ